MELKVKYNKTPIINKTIGVISDRLDDPFHATFDGVDYELFGPTISVTSIFGVVRQVFLGRGKRIAEQ